MLHDIRLAARSLTKSPGFTVVAVLTLALGIGANTAIFSVVHSVLLSPLAYEKPDGLYSLRSENPQRGNNAGLPPAVFRQLEKNLTSAESMAASYYYYYDIIGVAKPTQVTGAQVTTDYFKVFGAAPLLGRTFLPEDAKAGAQPSIVLSHSLWQGLFGGRPEIVGQSITVDDKPHIVLGVMPAGFKDPFDSQQLWRVVTEQSAENQNTNSRYWGVTLRLKPGRDSRSALTELETLAARYAAENPKDNEGWRFLLQPLRDIVVGNYSRGLILVVAASLLVLMLTCTNVASLQLVRAAARQREAAICMAVGATSWAIARRQLVESLLLSLAGTVAGLLLGRWGLDLLLASFSGGWLPRAAEISLNPAVLAASVCSALFAGVLAGVLPALQATRVDAGDVLKSGGKSGTAAGGMRVRSVLVVAQFAITLVVLACAGLVVKSFAAMLSVNPGMRIERTLRMVIGVSNARYDTPAKAIAYYQSILERVRALPGVENAAFIQTMPFTWGIPSIFTTEGRSPEAEALPTPFCDSVSTGYFQLMEIPLLAGRLFNAGDRQGSPRVVIISKSTEEKFFPGQDPIGRSLLSVGNGRTPPLPMTVVGVVGDVMRNGLNAQSPYQVYASLDQRSFAFASLLVTSPRPVEALAPSIQRAIWELNPDQPIGELGTVRELVRTSLTQPRLYVTLFGLFGVLALVLATLGLYGLVSYSVEQRTREFGIRAALGADTRSLRRLVLGQGLRLLTIGVVLGLAGSLAVTRLMQSLLFQTGTYDLPVFASVLALLVAVALAACWLPARRATKVDPVIALRSE